jgi:GAF domain-containing protein
VNTWNGNSVRSESSATSSGASESLARIQATLSAAQSPDELLTLVVQMLCQTLKGDSCAIGLLTDDASELQFQNHVGLGHDVRRSLSDLPRDVVERLRASRDVIVLDHVQRRTQLLTQLVRKDLNTLLIAAVHGKSRLIGVVTVGYVSDTPPRSEQLLTLRAVAEQAGLCLEHDKLAHDLSRRNTAMRLLLELSNITAAALTARECFEHMAHYLCAAFQTALCVILAPEPDTDDIRLEAAVAREGAGLEIAWDRTWIGLPVQNLTRHALLAAAPRSAVSVAADSVDGETLFQPLKDRLRISSPVTRAAIIPLDLGGETLGWCILADTGRSSVPHPFASEDLQLMTMAASQVAGVILRADESAAVLRREDRLLRLRDRSKRIFATLDIEEVLSLVSESAVDLLDAEVCSIFLRDGKEDIVLHCEHGAAVGATKQLRLKIRNGPRTGLTGFVAATGQPLNLVGASLTGHPARTSLGPHSHLPSRFCHALLALPISERSESDTTVGGVIKVENKKLRDGSVDRRHGFSNDDIVILTALAAYAQVALQNARAFGLSTALRQAALVVNSSLDLAQVLRTVLDQLKAVVPLDTASVWLRDGGVLRVVGCAGYDEEDTRAVLQLILPLSDQYPNTQVVEQGRPFAIDDVASSPFAHFRNEADHYKSAHIRSWLGVPLLTSRGCIGNISIDSRLPAHFLERDVASVILFAQHAASAIHNAELYDKLRQRLDELTKAKGMVGSITALAWMGMTHSVWRHAVEARLFSIRGQLELARRELSKGGHKTALSSINHRLTCAEELAKEIGAEPQVPVLSPTEGVGVIDLGAIVSTRVRLLAERADLSSIRFRVIPTSRVVLVRGNLEWLKHAIDILLDNAVAANRLTKAEGITVDIIERGHNATVRISDRGPGIPDSVRAVLFTIPVEKLPGERGMGIGLLLASAIATAYGGTVEVATTGPEGTVMSMTLPLATAGAATDI